MPRNQPTPLQEREPVAVTAAELRAALAGHGITLPSLGIDTVTYAAGRPDPLLSLGNCNLDTARRLAAVLRGLQAADPPGRPREPLTVHLLADPSALAELRRRVGSLLALWGLSRATADTARLCVSELVTNVVRHVGEGVPITLRVAMTDGRPRLELTDPDPRALPTLLSATGEDETGRGLALLDAFAARWGVTQHAHAKTTWCELDAEPVPASGPAPEPASPAGPGCGPPPDRGAASRVEPGCARPLAPAPVPVPAPVPEDVRERP